jgi:hypothetical protein
LPKEEISAEASRQRSAAKSLSQGYCYILVGRQDEFLTTLGVGCRVCNTGFSQELADICSQRYQQLRIGKTEIAGHGIPDKSILEAGLSHILPILNY